jgi:TonB-linked SusC/RagA family outer membrane protein
MKRLVTIPAVLVLMGIQLLNGQSLQITGNVTSSENGTALLGVSVVVKGTMIGTITDSQGNYLLAVPEDASTLVFSFMGMVTQEVTIVDATTIDVVLEPDILGIEEVFVTAIGITRKEKSLGYSVQGIESEEISRANTSDVINSISGRTAGVNITSSSGMPGSSVYMTIRGAASIIGDNQPLFVIDGMPIATGRGAMATTNRDPFNQGFGTTGGTNSSSRSIDLNPEDIASMTVLKGGAATALYGVRAANGVIVITTKKGTQSSKRVNVDFHTSVGFDRVSQLPPLQKKFVQGEYGEWESGSWGSWGPNADTLQYDTTTVPDYKWDKNGMIVGQSDPNANGIPVKMYDQYDFFQTGMTFNNRLSISSGNEQSTYYFSIADIEQSGIVPNSSFGRTNVRLNASTNLIRWLMVSTNMAYSNSRANQIQRGNNLSGVMLGLLRTPPSFDNSAGYEFTDGTQRNYRHGLVYDNPYWTVNKNYNDDRVNRFIGNAILNFTFTNWFSASYNVGLDIYTHQRKDVIAIGSRTRPEGAVEDRTRVSKQFNSDLLLNFHRSFGDFYAGLTLGNNLFQTGWEDLFGDANGLEIPDYYNLSNSADNETGSDVESYRTAALFFDLQLAYADMVFFGATGRNDWSTTMPEQHRSAFYPSLSMGFVFTEIPGLKGKNVLSFGKLRGSWARSANIADPYNVTNYFYPYTSSYVWTEISSPWMGRSCFRINDILGNPDLRHETMASYEVGADLRFLLNRFALDFSLFRNINTDLLLEVPITYSTGFGSVYMNAAEMESRGYELTLNARVLTGKVGWDIFVNWTKITNTVLSLAPGVDIVTLGGFGGWPKICAVAGNQYGSILSYDWYRDTISGTMLINDDPNDEHRDGYPMTDFRQIVPIVDVNPDWTANITNTFTWKGFRFSFMFDIKNGGWMYNGTAFALNDFGAHERTIDREVYYTPEGFIDFDKTPEKNLVVFNGVYGHVDEGDNPVSSGVVNVSPVVLDEDWYTKDGGSNFSGGSARAAMEPTDWVRLREVMLAYAIPVKKKIVSSAEIYFTGRNLWLNTPYSGIDPETNLQGAINGQGMDYFNMPGTRTYTIGLKLSF